MTARRPLPPVLVLAALLLAGCATSWQTEAPVTPSSYQTSRDHMARTEGKLRRLGVLVVEKAAPKACGRQTDNEASLERADEAILQTLVERKGYELVAIDRQRLADWLDAAALSGLAGDILARLEERDAKPKRGSPLQQVLERLRDDEKADGLLVLYRRLTCANAFTPSRVLIGIGTLGMNEFKPDEGLQELIAFHEGGLFETASGRIVWRVDTAATVSALLQEHFQFWKDAPKETGFARVIERLEPAVPKLLTR